MTLELIIGQLDVLANISEQESIVETKSLGGGLGCTPVDDPIMLPHIEEVEEGPMLGLKKEKGLSHSKVYTRINTILKHPSSNKTSPRNGGHGFWVPSFCYYLLPVSEKHGLL